MLEEKSKLEKEKEEILQAKMKKQALADAKKAKLLAENALKQTTDVNKIE